LIGLLFLALCVSLMFWLFYWNTEGRGPEPKQQITKTHSPSHVKEIRKIVEQCRHDVDLCAGGFFKLKGKDRAIRRLGDCHNFCGNHETGISRVNEYFRLNQADKDFDEVEFIVLPNDPAWELMAVAWSRQFVRKKIKQ